MSRLSIIFRLTSGDICLSLGISLSFPFVTVSEFFETFVIVVRLYYQSNLFLFLILHYYTIILILNHQ